MNTAPDLLKRSAALFAHNPFAFALAALLPLFVGLFGKVFIIGWDVLVVLPSILTGVKPLMAVVAVITVLVTIASIVAVLLAKLCQYVAIPIIARDADAGRRIKIATEYSKAIRLVPSVVFVSIIIAACAATGLFLFIIPGLFLIVFGSMAHFAVIFDDRRGIDAVAYSFYLVRKAFWRYMAYLIALAFSLIVIACAVAMAIAAFTVSILQIGQTNAAAAVVIGALIAILGAFVLLAAGIAIASISSIYHYYVYREIEKHVSAPSAKTMVRARHFVKWLGIIGIVLSFMAFALITTLASAKLSDVRSRSADEGTLYRSELYRVEFTYPDSWTPTRATATGTVVTAFSGTRAGDRRPESALVTLQQVDVGSSTEDFVADQFALASGRGMRNLDDVILFSKATLTVDGAPGFWYTFVAKDPADGTPVTGKRVVLVRGEYAYVFDFVDDAADFAATVRAFDQAVMSASIGR
jgi:hypothetical protein